VQGDAHDLFLEAMPRTNLDASFSLRHFVGLMKLASLSFLLSFSGLAAAPVQYEVSGVVREVDLAGSKVVVRHEAIPGYMQAMLMPFQVKSASELLAVRVGDRIKFQLNVTEEQDWIERVTVVGRDAGDSKGDLTLRPAPVELKEGASLPDFKLVDSNGRAVDRGSFKGVAFAYTFVFTRCPLPSMCPLLNRKFQQVQTLLDGSRCRLLSVSLDPLNDTSEVLARYGKSLGADPDRWTFCTGSEVEVRRLALFSGLNFWQEKGFISHNLRTVVVGADGTVRSVFEGNSWTVAELAQALRSAL